MLSIAAVPHAAAPLSSLVAGSNSGSDTTGTLVVIGLLVLVMFAILAGLRGSPETVVVVQRPFNVIGLMLLVIVIGVLFFAVVAPGTNLLGA